MTGGAGEAFPELIPPMMAVLGPLPAESDEAAYATEFKWDGVRIAAHIRAGTARLVSRNGRDVTTTYPDLAALGEVAGGRAVVLDGEAVAFDEAGRPDFGTLQNRMHVRAPTPALVAAVPVTYYAFDLLYLDGYSTLRLPYLARRELLDGLGLGAFRVVVPPFFAGAARAVYAAAAEQGLEGVVCKRLDSPYLPGRRTDLWRKTKVTSTTEVVVGGWRPGEGRRAGSIGSLLIGVPAAAGGVRYAGHVGTGFTEAMLHDLAALLRPLRRRASPFASELPREHARDAVWVEPRLVGEVAYSHVTKDGLFRHPSWRGLRSDKSPEDLYRD